MGRHSGGYSDFPHFFVSQKSQTLAACLLKKKERKKRRKEVHYIGVLVEDTPMSNIFGYFQSFCVVPKLVYLMSINRYENEVKCT